MVSAQDLTTPAAVLLQVTAVCTVQVEAAAPRSRPAGAHVAAPCAAADVTLGGGGHSSRAPPPPAQVATSRRRGADMRARRRRRRGARGRRPRSQPRLRGCCSPSRHSCARAARGCGCRGVFLLRHFHSVRRRAGAAAHRRRESPRERARDFPLPLARLSIDAALTRHAACRHPALTLHERGCRRQQGRVLCGPHAAPLHRRTRARRRQCACAGAQSAALPCGSSPRVTGIGAGVARAAAVAALPCAAARRARRLAVRGRTPPPPRMHVGVG